MPKPRHLGTIFFLSVILCSCDTGTDAPSGAAGTALNLSAIDAGNAADASDISLSFTRPTTENGISEYRVIIVRDSEKDDFDVAAASAVASSNYMSIPTGASTTRLSAASNDSNGSAIRELIDYVAVVLSVADGVTVADNSLSSFSPAFSLTQVLYVGTLVESIGIGTGGMEVDAAGNIYAADFGLDLNGGGTTVQKISPEGDVSVFTTGLNGASGNALDSQGNLLQSNITGGFISRISPSGAATTLTSSGINGPVGIAVDSSDNLFVANCGNNTIQSVTNAGVSTVFSSGTLFNCPNGITLANDGNLYVANFSNGNIIQVDDSGNASIFATIPGGNNGHILFANGVLYVVGRGANRIYQLSLTGSLSLIAGSGSRGHDDGSVTESTFSLPNDLAVSPDGTKIYVNEVTPLTGNNISPTTIRVIHLPTTIAADVQ